MLNVIWLFLIVSAVIYGGARGQINEVTAAAMASGRSAVDLVLGLTGVLCLWMGLMKIAEKSGLVHLIARALAPLTARLFPEIPRDHPVLGAIVLNVSANLLGLGNAATPFGLKAMAGLSELAEDKAVASKSMITFMALVTQSITLVPASLIALRLAAGAANPMDIVGPAVFASVCGTAATLIANNLMYRWQVRRRK